jgi:hypothetical protein
MSIRTVLSLGVVLTLALVRAEDAPPVAATPAPVAPAPAPATPATPKFEIIKATYGDLPEGGKVDVTDKIKALVNADGLKVTATNDAFTDPAEGIVKKLKVEYKLDDKTLEKSADENAELVIALKPAAPAGPTKLKVLKAVYGDLPDGTKADVTEKVQALVAENALTVGATNENFGDPVEGTVKKLHVDFSFEGGEKKSKEVGEGETLTISNKGE